MILKCEARYAGPIDERIVAMKAIKLTATKKGVEHSTRMLAILITLSVAATITVSVARKTPDAVIVWMTKEDPDVCIICEGFKGEYDPHDPNLPTIPPHPNGRCWWLIVFEVAEK